jgi:hypothetical protein
MDLHGTVANVSRVFAMLPSPHERLSLYLIEPGSDDPVENTISSRTISRALTHIITRLDDSITLIVSDSSDEDLNRGSVFTLEDHPSRDRQRLFI